MRTPKSDFSPIESTMMQGLAFNIILKSVRMRLFDTLDAGPMDAVEVAQRHGFRVDRTCALLDFLAAQGLLEHGPTGYANALVAEEHLVSTSPFFQDLNLELHNGFNTGIAEGLMELLQGEGEMRDEVDKGWGLQDSMEGTLQHARQGALQDTVAFAAALPGLNTSGLLADLGGNHGEFSCALLERHPDMRGELLDLPHVAKEAASRISGRGLSGRLRAVPLNLREERLEPEHYDLILASHILYGFVDELPETATMLHDGLKPGGWFVSHHLAPGGGLDPKYISAVQFITSMAGYSTHFISEDRLGNALSSAGFTDLRSCPAGKHASGLLLAARKR